MINRKDITFDPHLFGMSFFPQQMFLNPNAVPIAYFAMRQKPNDNFYPKEVWVDIERWLDFLGNHCVLGNMISDYTQWVWSDVMARVASFSSCNILLEGITEVTPQKRRLMTHNHPPRRGKTRHLTSTYITPIYVEGNVDQYFRYSDLRDIDYTSPSEESVAEGATTMSEWAKQFCDVYSWRFDNNPDMVWKHYPFPEYNDTLLIEFQADRFVHSVEKYNHNVFVAVTLNDVEYINPEDEHEISFKTIRNPDFLQW